MSRLASRLLAWYHTHKRRLPWRDHPDPYAVWVSEIMLQQTRVETVIPYFERWLERFPTVQALARASEQEVLNLWEGLGYYSRARNLHKAASIVVDQYHGNLPRDLDQLHLLPGIGRYTAGAIASMAFGMDEPTLDGNLRRVFSRLFAVRQLADSPAGERKLWALAAEHLPKGRAGDYNQALMDLGATLCLPKAPRCEACPLKGLCRARRLGAQERFPRMKPKGSTPHYTMAAAVILRRGRVLLVQRPSKGLLGGLWEFPSGRVEAEPGRELANAIRRDYTMRIKRKAELGVVRHAYSHFKVTVHAFLCEPVSIPRGARYKWVRLDELGEYPMGRVDRQIARRMEEKQPAAG